MKYDEHLISNQVLRPYVLVVWKIEDTQEGSQIRHIPKSQSMLVFNYGPASLIHFEEQKFTLGDTFILPTFSSSTMASLQGSTLIGITFVKDGLYRLLKENSGKLHFDIPSSMTAKMTELKNSCESKSLEEVCSIAESFLLKEMTLQEGPAGFERAIDLIEASHGCMSISEVCREAGISERGLQRHFNERLGLSPKKFSKITRVNTYLRELLENENKDWMEAVVNFNYHDQPHLINEFKSIIKLSPRDLLRYRDSLYHQVT